MPFEHPSCHPIIVNPDYVRRIERFRLTLEDGAVLPIPEKKYTRVRDQISRARRTPAEPEGT